MGEAVLRRGLLLVVGVAAAVLMAGAAAYACTAFATLEFASSAGAPGAAVEGTGKGFRSSHGQSPGGDVRVRWERRDGAELWAGEASEDGAVAFDLTVPDVPPGHYVIVATQSTTDPETGEETGTPVYGTPARQSFEVVAAASQGQLAPASSEPSAAPAEVSPQSAAPADAAGGSTGVAAPAGEPSQPASSPATGAGASASEPAPAGQPVAADAGGVPAQPAPAAAEQAPAAAVPSAVGTPEHQASSGQGAPAAPAPERFAAAERAEAAATPPVESASGTPASVAGGTQQRSAPTGWERFAAAERAAAGATAASRAPAGVVDMGRTAVPAVGSTAVSALDSGAVAVSIMVLLASLGLVAVVGRRLSGLRSAMAQ